MECPGENFCCRAGTTCGRDAAGNATCLDPNGATVTPAAPIGPSTSTTARNSFTNTNTIVNNNGGNSNANNGPTNTGTTTPSPSGGGNNNPLDNINPFKKSAALPQVAVASGLMVTVAFLSAFLVSSLTFSHEIIPDLIRHPALGFCS